ncbi:hypothetical protein DKM18_07910 [Mycobacterium tuberculosis variant bovis]|nr:hypothetical protein DKM18_07910 [Mycobacterium tuberculosis variant bovis]
MACRRLQQVRGRGDGGCRPGHPCRDLKELRSILAPECAARAREISTRMTRPTAAVTAAADLLEATARQTPGSTPSSSPGR